MLLLYTPKHEEIDSNGDKRKTSTYRNVYVCINKAMYTLMKCNDVKRRQLIKSQTVCTLFHETVLYFCCYFEIRRSYVLFYFLRSLYAFSDFDAADKLFRYFYYTIAEWLL